MSVAGELQSGICAVKVNISFFRISAHALMNTLHYPTHTVLPARSDSDVMVCLQNYQGLRINRALVY